MASPQHEDFWAQAGFGSFICSAETVGIGRVAFRFTRSMLICVCAAVPTVGVTTQEYVCYVNHKIEGSSNRVGSGPLSLAIET